MAARVVTHADPPRYNAIPEDIRAALGCDIGNRFNGLGIEHHNAEMRDGYRPAARSNGSPMSVFWCAQGADRFALAFVRDGRLMRPECPPVLAWRYFPKAALSISDAPEPLDDFAYVDRSKRRGHARLSGTTSGSIVVDGDDSLSNQFYCHKGAWMVRVLD
jgi:hypothetical protein